MLNQWGHNQYQGRTTSYALNWLFQQEQRVNIVSIPLVLEYEDVLTRPENLNRYPHFTKNEIGLIIDDIRAVYRQQNI